VLLCRQFHIPRCKLLTYVKQDIDGLLNQAHYASHLPEVIGDLGTRGRPREQAPQRLVSRGRTDLLATRGVPPALPGRQ
jgi:hypothetical protein